MNKITDLTPYRKHLDQFDLTEQQKLDFINAWWEIINNLWDAKLGIAEPMFEKKIDKEKS